MNEEMQCCEYEWNGSQRDSTLIRHYPNRDRPCDFQGEPSVFENAHVHSYECASDQDWPSDWTMQCLACGHNIRDDFFSNRDDIAGCGERRIYVGGVQIESPFSSPFYDLGTGISADRLIPLPRMRVNGTTIQISGTDLCQVLDLNPNVLSLHETFLLEKLQKIFDACPMIELVIEMEIMPQNRPDESQNNGSEPFDFADAQRLRNDEVEILQNSKLITTIRDLLNSIKINTTRPDETTAEIWLYDDPNDRIQGPPGMEREGRRERRRYASTISRAHIPLSIMQAVLARDGGRCVECGSVDDIIFDHIIPHSREGTFRSTNIQLLCKLCNSKKGSSL